jgi:hypothetical protein
MTELLLDHPWRIDESPENGRIILRFDNLLKRYGMVPVCFFSEAEWGIFLQKRRLGNFSAMIRAVYPLVRRYGGTARALPVAAPDDLSDDWKAALRDSMRNLDDWRCPQIVVPEIRRALWPLGDEIGVEFAADNEQNAIDRILVALEGYEAHRYALSDGDPWNLERVHPPSNQRVTHPCRLPKPAELDKCPLNELGERSKACIQDQGNYLYYLPSQGWSYRSVTKAQWRDHGHAFPYRSDAKPHHSGWVDREGRIWEWDINERHWDVQTDKAYLRVSHTGRKL